MKSFNINETVKVRLTEYGKEVHKQRHLDFWGSRDMIDKFPYTPPETTPDGYSKFQMWELMEKFGSYCGLGRELPFETDILIDEKDLKDA